MTTNKVSKKDEKITPAPCQLEILLASVPQSLYLENDWVRDICFEANKALVKIDQLEKLLK